MFGMEHVLNALGITPETIQDLKTKFEWVVSETQKFKVSQENLTARIEAAEKRAEERHTELLAAIRDGRPLN